jgi:hypothetical protein
MMKAAREAYLKQLYRGFYQNQNKKIHTARAQLNMSIDACRKIAEKISGKPSISSLSLEQRWNLLEELLRRGAKVMNPCPPREFLSPQWSRSIEQAKQGEHEAEEAPSRCVHMEPEESNMYSIHLHHWNQRFPHERPGFPSNAQLALINTLWDMYFNDNRKGRGLRGFIWRQTRTLVSGPVSDLAFLKNNHIAAVLTPLIRKSKDVMKKGNGRVQNKHTK